MDSQVRTLRRWLLVVGVWAVAASAVGLIALLESRETSKEAEESAELAVEVGRLRGDLRKRLATLDDRVGSAPSAEDISKIEDRLNQSEDDSQQAVQDAEDAREKIEDLEKRLDDAEGGASP